jgi:hypothetical protein
LEDIALESTSPEEPTLTTRSYQAQVMDNRIYGQGAAGAQPQLQKLIELVMSAKQGDYPPLAKPVLDRLLDKPRFSNDRCYARSKQIQSRQPADQQRHTDEEEGWGYIPYYVVVGAAIAIGLGFYLKSHQK